MVRTKITQKGFAAVEVLLAMIFIAIISFAGYYVWNSHQNNVVKDSKVSEKKLPKATTPSVTDRPPESQPEQNYLTIKEWNVKIPLEDGIEDAYYEPNNYGMMGLSTKSLVAQYAQCSPTGTAPGS